MISLCMIVKNEIKYIEKCLKSVQTYVDEMIIVDTGSTDGTIEILEKYNCKVYHFEWCDDFAKARNFSVSKAKYNWILILDADEEVIEFDEKTVRALVKSNRGEIRGVIKNRSFMGTAARVNSVLLHRFYNKKFYKFERDIHEYLVPKFNFNSIDMDIKVTVNHYGYLDATYSEKGKNENYLEKLKKSIANKYDPYLVKHLAGTYFNIEDYEQSIIEADKILTDKSLYEEHYFPEAVLIKTKALMGLRRNEDALKMQEYFEYCQNNDEYIMFMGFVFSENNLYDDAIAIYNYLFSKTELTISRLEVIYGLGTVYFELENYEEALKWFEMINVTDGVKEKIAICKLKLGL